MALVELPPAPVGHNHGTNVNNWATTMSTFGRYSPCRRAESPNRTPDTFTLESLACLLSTSPTGGFSYLSGDLYTAKNTTGIEDISARRHLQKSRSFPTVKRDEPLKSCVSERTTVRRSKSVRFADSQGLPLVEAVHPLTSADPSYTENQIVPYGDEEVFGPVPTLTAPVKLKNAAKETSESEVACSLAPQRPLSRAKSSPAYSSPPKRQLSPTYKRMFMFNQPGVEPGFYNRVNREKVVLESIRAETRSVHGIIRVSNLEYHKEVTVRWTHDSWKTHHDTNAVFCATDGDTDRFTFELPVNGDDVSFAIRYRTNGQEFWDSNRGRNYLITRSR